MGVCWWKDNVPGLTKPEPGTSTAKRAFWYLGLYNNFFQSWLWAGKEDMLSEADPPANYQFCLFPLTKPSSRERDKKIYFVLIGTWMCSRMRLFLVTQLGGHFALTKEARGKVKLLFPLTYLLSIMQYFLVPNIATTEGNKHFLWTYYLWCSHHDYQHVNSGVGQLSTMLSSK